MAATEIRLRDRHQMIGHFNPRCARCGRSLIDLARRPQVPCQRKVIAIIGDLEPIILPVPIIPERRS